jgi:dTDP-4-amino-4,6-dideoxygalactose transaminase
LNDAGVETRPYFSVIPHQTSYRRLRYTPASSPNSMRAHARGIYVSCSPALTQVQKKLIIKTVQETLNDVR